MSVRARFLICDVFTDRPLAGNQLAVFTAAAEIPDALLLPIAREMHFSETVFAYPPAADGDARVRIFTPARELPFAGHPILGAAVALAGDRDAIRLETARGLVPVTFRREPGRALFGVMSQPLPRVSPHPRPDALLAALGVARSALPVEVYDSGPRHVFVTLDDPGAIARLAPDLGALGRLGELCASCVAGAGRRWTSRVFCPGLGVAEDPATGSAAGPLAVHLARHGRIAFGDEIEIAQGAELGRPSTLFARAVGSAERLERVEVGGSAVVVGEGALVVG